VNTIALYNLKGGVGKTSAAVNLACLAAESGVPTLIWDLDPQGAASWFFGAGPGPALSEVVAGRVPVGRLRQASGRPGLDLIPASLVDRHLDGVLAGMTGRKRLRELIAPFGETHALVILDCPPSISRLAEHVFKAADAIFVPVLPTPLSQHAYARLGAFFDHKGLPQRRLHPFFSQVDRRRRLHADWLAEPPAEFAGIMRAFVPYAAAVEYAMRDRRPVSEQAPHSAAAHAYRLLWQELRALLGQA